MGLAGPEAGPPEPMPRVKIGPALPDREALDVEIAQLRDLDVQRLRSRKFTRQEQPSSRPPDQQIRARA